jgi:tetratricopeptide (TPR) repeat protein
MVLAPRWTGLEAAALRQARRMSIRAYAASLGVSAATVANWDRRGEHAHLNTETQQLLDIDLVRAPEDVRERFASALAERPRGDINGNAAEDPFDRSAASTGQVAFTLADTDSDGGLNEIEVPGGRGRQQVELVRQGLISALHDGAMVDATVDDWDLTVLRHGRATRDRPAGVVLEDLRTDLADLTQALHRHRSNSSALRQLTRVAAQMSGLMTLTLCKLDQRSGFRRWARVARVAAKNAGDSETHSWTLAQEAYGHFYSGDLTEAIDVAQQAQGVVATPCVGTALAAALEGRAYAVMGRGQETRSALGRAEASLSDLEGEALAPSAFGYNEGQLRFHEGNAYTHLGDVRLALKAQDRALELCAPDDYTDWAMTQLDRTSCLAKSDDTTSALNTAKEALATLSEAQRWGLITLRGHEVLNSLPKGQQTLAAAGDLRELLMLTTTD